MKNAKEIAAVGKISTDDLETSGDVRSNGKITVNGNLENSGNVETGSDIAVSKDIKNSGKVLANGNLSGKNAENSNFPAFGRCHSGFGANAENQKRNR